MKRLLLSALLAVLLCIPWTQAQTSIPYTMDFESESSWPVSDWTTVGSGTKSISTSSLQAHGGSNSLKFSVSTSNIAILPEFTSDISNLQLEIWWKPEGSYSSCANFDFGYITDVNDASSFVTVKTVNYADYGNVYHKETLYFGQAPTGARMALRARPTSGSYYWFVDDITVSTAPSCFPVSAVAATNISATSADIIWTAGKDETQWQYVYDTIGFTPDWTNATLVSTNSVSLTGLTANTHYDVYVRSYCSATDQGDSVKAQFHTLCNAITTASLPYTEDFESYVGTTYSTAGPTPDCWDVSAAASTKPHVLSTTVSTSYAYVNSGTNALTFYGSGNCYAVFPQFESALNTLMVSFYKGMESSSNGILVLGYITAADQDMNSFTPIDTIESTYRTPMGYYERNLNDLPATAYRLALRWYYSGQYTCCVDDITVDVIPTCPKPTDVTADESNITSTSAAISWTAGSTETVWNLQYKLNSDSVWTTVYNITYPYTISGLTPNTKYDVRVQGICTAGVDSSAWSISSTFKTLCAAVNPASLGVISFETSEGFTSGSGKMANCWTVGNKKSTSSSYIPYVYNSATNSRTGSNCLNFYATSATSDSAYAVMPEFTYTGSIASYEAHFYMRKATTSTYSSYNDTLWVGIVSDPEDLSDLQIVGYGVNTTATYAQQVVTFGSYNGGTTGYIVFLATRDLNASQSSKYASFYVDDIEIVKGRATTTPVIDSVYNITTTTAQVAFSGSNATSYRIVAATEPVSNPDTYTTWAIDTVVTASPATISVQAANYYYLYIQGIGTDTSFFSNPVTQFQSGCDVVASFPWTENFDEFTTSGEFAKVCWFNELVDGPGTYPAQISTSGMGDNETPMLYFKDQNATTYTRVSTPEFNIPTAGAYEFNIDVYRGTASYGSKALEGVNVIIENATGGYDTTFIPQEYNLAGTVGAVAVANTWYTYTISLPKAGVQRVILLGCNQYGTSVYVDNLRVRRTPLTHTPVIDSVYNITTTTADVAFHSDNATSYRIMAATEAVAEPDTFTSWAIDTVVTTSPATINVQSSTKYYLYIQGIGADTSLISNPTQFRSECAAFAIPFVCGFEPSEGFTSSSAWVDGALEGGCWNTLGMKPEGEVYPYYYITNSTYLHSGTQGLKGNSDGSGVYGYWILPEFAVPTNSLSMELWYRNEGTYASSPYVEIGYMTDPTDSTTFVMLQQLAKATTMTLATQSFAGPNVPSTARIAVRFGGATSDGYFCGIDDIRVINPYDSVSVVATPQVSNTGTVEGAGRYLRGASVTLTATPAEHYHFVQWVEDGVTTATRTITASADTTYFTAQFDADSFNITGLSADTVMGTVTGSGRFPYNYTAQLTATANYGYHFTGWSNGDNTASTFITVTGDSTITANFAPDTFAVTLNVNDASMGTVTGAGNYVYNTTATLIAVPNAGHHFVNWSNGETNDTITITVTAATTLTATFAVDSFNITVLSSDTVMGTVTGAGRYPLNYTAQLTATANYGYHFTGWSNGDTTATTFVTVTNDATITANFAKNQYTVTLTADPSNGGTVSGDGTYNYLDTVTVIATPASQYRFTSWSNGVTNDTLTFVITGDTALTANFEVNLYDITVYYNNNLGDVTGNGWYPYGTVVTLTATPKYYSHFLGWGHGRDTAATPSYNIFDTASTITITLTSDTVYTAYFAFDTLTVTAVADPADGGTVTGGGEYQHGSYVTLTATPADGYEFTGWSNGKTADTITFMVTSDTTFTASFKLKSTAVDNVEAAQYVAYTEGHRIVVTGVEGHTVSVFDATGRLVATRTNAEDTETFDTPLAGVYMIKVNGMNTTAIVVK